VLNDNDKIPRPVRRTDFLVIATGFLYNITQVFETFMSELYELSIYHANHKTKVNQAWEEMATDLETLEEDK
jgi:2-hydroxy-3-keto-5-methylthiopentenyl-1-phosphate phosphatase